MTPQIGTREHIVIQVYIIALFSVILVVTLQVEIIHKPFTAMKTHPYRISEAAAGRTFIEILRMVRSSELHKDQLHDMMFAALNYIEAENEPAAASKLNPGIWGRVKAGIDRSARRSAAARARAAARKQKNQSLISGAAKPVAELLTSAPSPAPAAESASAVSQMDTQHLRELLPLLSPENQKELLRMEQEKFEYAKEQEQKRKEEAAEQERKRKEDEKIAERKRKEELERKREEMDAFVSWQLAGRPPTNRRFNIF